MWHNNYRDASRYLTSCKESVTDPGYVVNPYGRTRRFPYTNREETVAAMQREAANFPIQSTVGDTMSLALINFANYRKQNPGIFYRILVSKHDEVLIETPVENVEVVKNKVFPTCMVDEAVVPGYNLTFPLGDLEVMKEWGIKVKEEELETLIV